MVKEPRVVYEAKEETIAKSYRGPWAGLPRLYPSGESGFIDGRVFLKSNEWQFGYGEKRATDLNWRRVLFATNRASIAVMRAGPFPMHSLTFGEEVGPLSLGVAMIGDDDMDSIGALSADAGPPKDTLERTLPAEISEVSVLVHGCCSDFEGGLKKIGRLARKVSFTSTPALFSWPSGPDPSHYIGDRSMSILSRDQLLAYLNALAARDHIKHIDVIAHSQGNMVLIEALRTMLLGNAESSAMLKDKLRHIIFASPDVEAITFKEMVGAMTALGRSRTLYASHYDYTLWGQTKLSGRPSAGYFSESPLIVQGTDTIDTSNAKWRYIDLGHSAFSDDPMVMNDVGLILRTGTRPPDARYPMLHPTTGKDGTYWYFASP